MKVSDLISPPSNGIPSGVPQLLLPLLNEALARNSFEVNLRPTLPPLMSHPVLYLSPQPQYSLPSQGYPAYPSPQSPQYESPQRKRRQNLPKVTTDILMDWLIQNLERPYPNSHEKQELAARTGLSAQQLDNWFINARRRKLKSIKESMGK